MSTKRQPSKQRRQTQNRQQRAALQARRAAAAAGEAPAGKVGGSGPAKSGSVLSRLTGSTGTSKASRPSASARRKTLASNLPIGHRAALTAVMLAGASLIFVLGAFRVPVSEAGEPIATGPERVAEWSVAAARAVIAEGPDATAEEVGDAIDDWSPGGKEAYITAFWPLSLSVFLPVIGAALGFRAVSKRASAKVVNRAMYATLFGALLTTQLLIFFLPGVVAMGIAAFQVRKAEFAAASAGAADDDVIDVEEVDEVDDVEVDDVEVDDEDEPEG